jgi:hypothetical protein
VKHVRLPAGMALATAVALPAQAQLLAHKDLSMATALVIATTAIDKVADQLK